MNVKKNIYFISDAHLGMGNYRKSRDREKLLVKWLDEVSKDAKEIYMLGDIFDFWFEYKKVIPRGFSRFLGKLSEITDSGIPVHFFTGNHDLWVFDYLPEETGVILHKEPIIKELSGKKFYMAHGDGLGKFDKKYRLLKKIFTNKLIQWLFARLHPNFAFSLAHGWSKQSRYANQNKEEGFKGIDKEWLALYAKDILKNEHFDFFIFGHRHNAVNMELTNNCRYINLGDWIANYSYGVFDGNKFELLRYSERKVESGKFKVQS